MEVYICSQDVNWWIVVVWILVDYVMFLSAVWTTHSDGTHSLQRSHWWASDVMQHFSKLVPDELTNASTWMPWGRGNFQQYFIFRRTFFLVCFCCHSVDVISHYDGIILFWWVLIPVSIVLLMEVESVKFDSKRFHKMLQFSMLNKEP